MRDEAHPERLDRAVAAQLGDELDVGEEIAELTAAALQSDAQARV